VKFGLRIQSFLQQHRDSFRTKRRVPAEDDIGDYAGVMAGWHEKDRMMIVRRDVPSCPDINRLPMSIFVYDQYNQKFPPRNAAGHMESAGAFLYRAEFRSSVSRGPR